MQRLHAGLMIGFLSVFSFALLSSGCRPADEDDDVPRRRKREGGDTPVFVEAKLKPLAGKDGKTGTISGKIVWEGSTPDLTARVNINRDEEVCLKGASYEVEQYQFRIGANKLLGNVFVWIEAPEFCYLEVPEKVIQDLPPEARMSQPHCAFMPHCLIHVRRYTKDGVPVSTKQKFIIENDAVVPHSAVFNRANINAQLPGKTVEMVDGKAVDKIAQVVATSGVTPQPEAISCGVHSWMKGYIGVYDHPFVALSSVGADLKGPKKVYENPNDPKFGTYEIQGVPVGVQVRIIAWHESLGYLNKGDAKGEAITLTEATVKDFTAKK